MPIFGWIRDALGIHKDNVEIDKAELEITKLEDEERARHLITPATMDDIKQFDPKYRRIRNRRDTHKVDFDEFGRETSYSCPILLLGLLLMLALITYALYRFLR